MQVFNRHQRRIPLPCARVGALIDSLASTEDLLWPHYLWPKMKFDKPLAISAKGGHGPIRYFVESYARGKSICFRFMEPKGFNGFHRYDVIAESENSCCLQHTLEMQTSLLAILSWPFIFRPLHDALIEDSLATAQLRIVKSVRTLNLGPLGSKYCAGCSPAENQNRKLFDLPSGQCPIEH